jgi:hypothetical protein
MKALVLILAAAAIFATPAAAQQPVCKPRAELVLILFTKHGETQQSFGLQSDGRVLEVFASHTGSWTAFVTLPGGQACVVVSGQAWTSLPVQVGAPT